jgi:hypothetical protein
MDKKGRVTKFKPRELPELLDSHWLELARVAPHTLYLQITFSSIFLGSKQNGMKQNYSSRLVWAQGKQTNLLYDWLLIFVDLTVLRGSSTRICSPHSVPRGDEIH